MTRGSRNGGVRLGCGALAAAAALAACSSGGGTPAVDASHSLPGDAAAEDGDLDAGPDLLAPCSSLSSAVRDALGRSPECDKFAPVVTSVDPPDGATGVEPTTTVTLRFSPGVDPPTVTATSVMVTENGRPVAGALAVAPGQVVFTPAQRLALLATYTVTVTTDVAGAEGVTLAQPFTASFRVRDGRWEPQPDFTTEIVIQSAAVAANHGGDLLLVNQDHSGASLGEVLVRVYHPATGWADQAAVSLDADSTTGTANLGPVALADSGDALVVYTRDASPVTSTLSAAQLHAGVWLPPHELTPTRDSNPTSVVVAMAPDGSGVAGFDLAPSLPPPPGPFTPVLAHVAPDGTWTSPPASEPPPTNAGTLVLAMDAAGGAMMLYPPASADRVRAARFSVTAGSWSWLGDDELPGSALAGGAQIGGQPALAADERGRFVALWARVPAPDDAAGQTAILAALYDPALGWSTPSVLKTTDPLSLTAASFRLHVQASGGGFIAWWPREDGPWFALEVSRLLADGTWMTSSSLDQNGDNDVAAGVDARGNILAVWTPGPTPDATPLAARFAGATGAWSALAWPDDAARTLRDVWLAVAGDGTGIAIFEQLVMRSPMRTLYVDLFR